MYFFAKFSKEMVCYSLKICYFLLFSQNSYQILMDIHIFLFLSTPAWTKTSKNTLNLIVSRETDDH